MPKMDKITFQHLCELSKLSFGEDEQDKIIEQMDGIIALMDTARDYDGEPETGGTHGAMNYSQLREDKVQKSFAAEKLMQNGDEGGNCTLPRIIG